MMGWLPKFFGKKTVQQFRQSTDSAPAPTTMIQVVVEQTIMTAANWLIHFVNRSLESKGAAFAGQQPEPKAGEKHSEKTGVTAVPSVESTPATVESLTAKLGTLLEQACDRTQATAVLAASLEERLAAIEASLQQNQRQSQVPVAELAQAFVHLENRFNQLEARIAPIDPQAIEASLQASQQQINQRIDQQIDQQINQQTNQQLNQIHQVSQQLNQMNQTLGQELQELKAALALLDDRMIPVENFAEHSSSMIRSIAQTQQTNETLESRINHLEKLIAQFRLIPKLVEGNYRAIASLQQHFDRTDVRSIRDGKGNEAEAANVVSISKAR